MLYMKIEQEMEQKWAMSLTPALDSGQTWAQLESGVSTFSSPTQNPQLSWVPGQSSEYRESTKPIAWHKDRAPPMFPVPLFLQVAL